MIKCNVYVCAEINRSAVSKENNGEEFFTFGVKVPVTGRNGEKKDLEISVSHDGGKGKAALFTTGKRVAIKGVMTVRKKNGRTYYNLRSEGDAELTKSTAEDRIEGSMEFRGKTGKDEIETKNDKNGNPYKSFSAFSRDKEGDNAEFTWVNFMYFNPKDGEDFIAPGKYVSVKGDLQLNVYKEEVRLSCRINEIAPWEMESK